MTFCYLYHVMILKIGIVPTGLDQQFLVGSASFTCTTFLAPEFVHCHTSSTLVYNRNCSLKSGIFSDLQG